MIPPKMRTAASCVLALGLLIVAAVGFRPAPARAATAVVAQDERITSYDLAYEIQESGTVHVKEKIKYDFGDNRKRGIYREIPIRAYDTDPGGDSRERRYEISDIKVSSPTGAPTETTVTDGVQERRIRIGDPDRTVTGTHDYVLEYDLRSVLTSRDSNDELEWIAIGLDWEVPISDVTVEVTAPVTIETASCRVRTDGETESCDSPDEKGKRARFTQSTLKPPLTLVFTVTLPKGAVDVEPLYVTDETPESSETSEASAPPSPRSSGPGFLLSGFLVLFITLFIVVIAMARAAGSSRAGTYGTARSRDWRWGHHSSGYGGGSYTSSSSSSWGSSDSGSGFSGGGDSGSGFSGGGDSGSGFSGGGSFGGGGGDSGGGGGGGSW